MSCDEVQGEALLVTATEKQAECLSEIIRNVLRLPVSRKTKDLIKLHQNTLTLLADKEITKEKRVKLIQKSYLMILHLLLSVKKNLVPLL